MPPPLHRNRTGHTQRAPTRRPLEPPLLSGSITLRLHPPGDPLAGATDGTVTRTSPARLSRSGTPLREAVPGRGIEPRFRDSESRVLPTRRSRINGTSVGGTGIEPASFRLRVCCVTLTPTPDGSGGTHRNRTGPAEIKSLPLHLGANVPPCLRALRPSVCASSVPRRDLQWGARESNPSPKATRLQRASAPGHWSHPELDGRGGASIALADRVGLDAHRESPARSFEGRTVFFPAAFHALAALMGRTA